MIYEYMGDWKSKPTEFVKSSYRLSDGLGSGLHLKINLSHVPMHFIIKVNINAFQI